MCIRDSVRALANGLTDIWAMSGNLQGERLRVSVGNDCPEEASENLRLTVPAYSIVLTWGAEPPDLDSHLLIPMTWDDAYDYYHICFYSMGRLGDRPYAMLDVDDTSGFGPEIVTGTRVYEGRFQFWVNDYLTEDTASVAASGAMVQLALGGALYHFEVSAVPTAGAHQGGWWHVFDILVDGSEVALEPVMRFEERFSFDGVYAPEAKGASK
jgi:hypothetical protein